MNKNNHTKNRTTYPFIFMHFGAFECIFHTENGMLKTLINSNNFNMLNWSARLDLNQRPLAPQAYLFLSQVFEIIKLFIEAIPKTIPRVLINYKKNLNEIFQIRSITYLNIAQL